MSHSFEEQQDLYDLLDRLIEGSLGDSETVRLNQLLASSEAQRSYVDYLTLHAALRFRASSQSFANALQSVLDEANLSGAVATSGVEPIETYVDAQLVSARPHVSSPRLPSRVLTVLGKAASGFATPVMWSILLVAMATYGTFAVISWDLRDGKKPRPASSHEVATVANADGAQWASAAERPAADASIKSGQSLKISSGQVRLNLRQGALLTIHGPAEWSIDGENQASLKLGTLVATVGKQAIGFTVRTPSSTIVDLGTEFGVTVGKDGRTETQVFQGVIEVKPDVSTASGVIQIPATRKLVAGEAVRIDGAGNVSAIPPIANSSQQFIQSANPENTAIQKTTLSFEPSHPYSEAVLKTSGLVGYWRLGESDPPRAKDEVGANAGRPLGRSEGRHFGFATADFRQPGALSGSTNYATRFHGKTGIEIGDHSNLGGDSQGLTITAWINPAQTDHWNLQAIACKWATRPTKDAFLLGIIERKLFIAVGDGKVMENGFAGAGNYPVQSGKFNFVVGTWNAATREYRLYVDGHADSAIGIQDGNGLHAAPTTPISIGSQVLCEYAILNHRYYAGQIDEVAIFNRALSVQEIQHLYQLGSGSPN
jgi:hypothetical protein